MKTFNPLIIINGPTGVGKTTIIKKIIKKFPRLRTGVTYTTRPVRPQDKEDKDMRHITRAVFTKMIERDEFLEWAEFSDNYYGTARKENLTILSHHPLLLNVEVVGTFTIKKLFPETVTIYILPDSIDQLKLHLKNRSFTDKQREARLKAATWSIGQAYRYDHQIENHEGDVGGTIDKVSEIIKKTLKK